MTVKSMRLQKLPLLGSNQDSPDPESTVSRGGRGEKLAERSVKTNLGHVAPTKSHTISHRKGPDFSRRNLPAGGQPGLPTNCELCPRPYVTKLHTVRLCSVHLERVNEIAADAKGFSGRKPDVQAVKLMAVAV